MGQSGFVSCDQVWPKTPWSRSNCGLCCVDADTAVSRTLWPLLLLVSCVDDCLTDARRASWKAFHGDAALGGVLLRRGVYTLAQGEKGKASVTCAGTIIRGT